jgi:phenylacetate-coenzyme A ligase PaaK-like adenylate-forming protein
MLSFYIPHFGMDEACEPLGLGHIGAIPDDLPATARMAALSQIDALAGAVSPILTFAPELARTYDRTRIRYIHLWGERPSSAQFDELAACYPRAELTWEYSNIETGGQSGRACETLASLKDDRVHPLADRYYWELIDTEGRTITDAGTEGEIVLTTLWPGNAFPALRFRTGDLARRCAPLCACEAETFQILGRVMFDRAVIPGGELKSEELERALAPFSRDIAGNFELHVSSDAHPSLTLYVEARHPDVSFALIREHVLVHLRVSATQTLSDALERGLIEDLAIAAREATDSKVRRIVRR